MHREVNLTTRLGQFYTMTPLIFLATSTLAQCVSTYDFHDFPTSTDYFSSALLQCG